MVVRTCANVLFIISAIGNQMAISEKSPKDMKKLKSGVIGVVLLRVPGALSPVIIAEFTGVDLDDLCETVTKDDGTTEKVCLEDGEIKKHHQGARLCDIWRRNSRVCRAGCSGRKVLTFKEMFVVGAAASPSVLFYKLGMVPVDNLALLWRLLVFWLLTCAVDMAYTVRYRAYIAEREQNPLLRTLARRLPLRNKRYGLGAAVGVMLAAEVLLVALVASLVVVRELDVVFVAYVSGVADGAAYLVGLAQTVVFVRRIRTTGSLRHAQW